MKNVLKQLAKSVLIPLGLYASVSATIAIIQQKIQSSGSTISLISNEEIKDIMKIVKFLEESGFMTKSVSETIENDAKEQKGDFLACYQVHQVLV